jgi:hypothetical protein
LAVVVVEGGGSVDAEVDGEGVGCRACTSEGINQVGGSVFRNAVGGKG